MIYNYLKANSNDVFLNRIFSILIDESFFHFKKFAQMMADMGILAIPRIVKEELYKVKDISKFLKDGINEEINAKEECRLLSEAVSKDSDELAKFFDLINNQENYHISLMQEALKYYAKS
jgi:rubrerythrin